MVNLYTEWVRTALESSDPEYRLKNIKSQLEAWIHREESRIKNWKVILDKVNQELKKIIS